MKLLLENWREFVKQEVEEFLPHGEVRAVERIGSSTLSPEDKVKQDLEKYGHVRDEDERDFDIEVQIAGVSNEDVEEWAFSEEAEELESSYNYDVQLRIVENWREYMKENIDLDIKVGDVLLGGRYKNKRIVVKEIGVDELGQPTVNGKPILKFRIEKHLPDEKKSKKTLETEK